MSQTLIAITGLIYLYVGAEQLWKGNSGGAVMFFAYAAANVGIFMQAK